MALPAQSVAILRRVAVLDVVIGLGLAAYGLAGNAPVLGLLGALLAATGLGMFLWGRAQRPEPEGPVGR